MKAVLELGDLIKLQTASPMHTLKRLSAWDNQHRLNDAHRAHLLDTAKLAVQVAHSEFNRASRAAQQRAWRGGGGALDPAPTIQFPDVTDLQNFANAAKGVVGEQASSLSNFSFSRGASLQLKRAADVLETVAGDVARGGAAAEIQDIGWAVERKCMYWDAVAMMDARIGEVGRVGGVAQRLRRHSG
jgi:hypothetical protein